MKADKSARVLISWLGNADIKALLSTQSSPSISSALFTVLTATYYGPFKELWLFLTPAGAKDSYTGTERDQAVNRLKTYCAGLGTKLYPVFTEQDFEIANMDRIYEFMQGELATLKRERGGKFQFYYNLTSGTPATYAICLYLSGKSEFAGVPLYSMAPDSRNPHIYKVFEANLPDKLARLEVEDHSDLTVFEGPNARIYEQVRAKVANTDATVLIQGETGTGKTVLAKYIHQHDHSRKNGPFEEVNCAAFGSDANVILSELFGHKKGAFTDAKNDRDGAFKKAHKGTLFLDEIGEIPLQHQGLLLKVLDDGKYKPLGGDNEEVVDVRVISATNVDLMKAVQEGRFRSDLFYRIAHYMPVLKPIRDYTPAQREKLLEHILDEVNLKYTFKEKRTLDAEARKALLNYPCFGNIRELKFRLNSICLLADTIVTVRDVEDQLNSLKSLHARNRESLVLPGDLPPSENCAVQQLPEDLDIWQKEWEAYWLRSAMSNFKTDAEAAKRLGLPKRSFSRRKGKLNLHRED